MIFVIDTSSAPTVPARKVEALKPDLLLTQEHHMCPGCGEHQTIVRMASTATTECGHCGSSMLVEV